jgi:hypothetical protein
MAKETWGEAIDGTFSDLARDIEESFKSAMHDLWHGHSSSSSGSGSSGDKESGRGYFCNVPSHKD